MTLEEIMDKLFVSDWREKIEQDNESGCELRMHRLILEKTLAICKQEIVQAKIEENQYWQRHPQTKYGYRNLLENRIRELSLSSTPAKLDDTKNITGHVDRIWLDCFDSELFNVEQMKIIESAVTDAKRGINAIICNT